MFVINLNFLLLRDVEAVEAASLHPAKLLGLEQKKGTLYMGADADFILLNERSFVQEAYIRGVVLKI